MVSVPPGSGTKLPYPDNRFGAVLTDPLSISEYPTVRREIAARVRQKLEQFWAEGIRGADFFMSAIGPAVEAFGKYARVEKLSGEKVEVAELLADVRQGVSEFALERILALTPFAEEAVALAKQVVEGGLRP